MAACTPISSVPSPGGVAAASGVAATAPSEIDDSPEPSEQPSGATRNSQSPSPPRKQPTAQRVLPRSPDADTAPLDTLLRQPPFSTSFSVSASPAPGPEDTRTLPPRPLDARAAPEHTLSALHLPDSDAALPEERSPPEEVCSEKTEPPECAAFAATEALVAEIERLSRDMAYPERRLPATPLDRQSATATAVSSSSIAVASIGQQVASASASDARQTQGQQQQLDDIDLEIMRKEESLQRLEELLEAEAEARSQPSPALESHGPWNELQGSLRAPQVLEPLQTTRWPTAASALFYPLPMVPLHEHEAAAPLSDRESTRSELATCVGHDDDALEHSPAAAGAAQSGYHSADECFTASEYLQHKRQMHQWSGAQWRTQPPPPLPLPQLHAWGYEPALYAAALYSPPVAMQQLHLAHQFRSLQATPMHMSRGALPQYPQAAFEAQEADGGVWQLQHSAPLALHPAAAAVCYRSHQPEAAAADGWLCGTCLHEVHQHGPGAAAGGEALVERAERTLSPSSGQSCSSQAESGSRTRNKRMLLTRDARYGSQSAPSSLSPSSLGFRLHYTPTYNLLMLVRSWRARSRRRLPGGRRPRVAN